MFFQRVFDTVKLLIVMMVICTVNRTFATADNGQNAIDFLQLKEYAVFAHATYLTEAEISRISELKHYTLSRYGNILELEVSYFLLTNDKTRAQVIAVRGTSNVENVLIDVDLKLKTDRYAGIRLHSGFSQAAEKIYQEIKPLLKPDYAVSTTGHSLGGAVALILAMYLDLDHFNSNRVVTFGQPKVTNITGAKKFEHLDIIRVVMPRDLVPLVPLLDPVDINDLDIYWHAGKEVILLADTSYAILEGVSSMLRATRFTREPLTENNLQEHQMGLYLRMLDTKIPTARLVPFKNSLNLFNLFGGE